MIHASLYVLFDGVVVVLVTTVVIRAVRARQAHTSLPVLLAGAGFAAGAVLSMIGGWPAIDSLLRLLGVGAALVFLHMLSHRPVSPGLFLVPVAVAGFVLLQAPPDTDLGLKMVSAGHALVGGIALATIFRVLVAICFGQLRVGRDLAYLLCGLSLFASGTALGYLACLAGMYPVSLLTLLVSICSVALWAVIGWGTMRPPVRLTRGSYDTTSRPGFGRVSGFRVGRLLRAVLLPPDRAK